MKIVDVLQKTKDDDNDITWILVVDDVPQKYIDMTYKMDESDYFNGHGLEIECITTNGKVNQDYDVNLQYYFDDYEVVAILNDDKEAIKCIEDFVNGIGNSLPFSEDKGQLEYSEMIQGMLMEGKMTNNAENTSNQKLLSLPEAAAKLHWHWKEFEETFQCRCNCSKSDLEYLGDRTVTEIRCRNCGKKIVKVPRFNIKTDECGWDKVFVTVDPENK